MAAISKSVRAGIAAMLTAGALEVPAAAISGSNPDAGNGPHNPFSSDIQMARSGYIVVAG